MASADENVDNITLGKFSFTIEDHDRNVELTKDSIIWQSQEFPNSKKKRSSINLTTNRLEFRNILRIEAVQGGQVGEENGAVKKEDSALIIDYVHRNRIVDPSSKIQYTPMDKVSPNYTWRLKKVTMLCPVDMFGQCEQIADTVKTYIAENEKQRPKKLFILVNPVGGKKKGLSIYEKTVQPILDLAGVAADVIESKYHNHVHEILDTYDLDSVDGLVAVGGDGILNQLINGITQRAAKDRGIDLNDGNVEMEQLPKRVAIIPAGSGNGAVGLATGTKDIVTAVLHIVLGTSCDVNLFSVHSGSSLVHYGFMFAFYGIGGDSAYESERNRGLGMFRFIYGLGRSLIKLHSNPLTIQVKVKSDEEDQSSDWVEEKGGFLMADSILSDFYSTPDFVDPVVHASVCWQQGLCSLNVVKDSAGRMKIIKLVKALTGGNWKTIQEMEDVSSYKCEEYKLILTEPSTSPSKSNGQASAIISIDGDPYVLDHPEVHVRLRRHMMKFFGTGLTYEGDKLAFDFRRQKSEKSAK